MALKICKILKGIEKHRDLIDEAQEVFDSGSAGRDKRCVVNLFEITDSQCEADIERRLKKIRTSYSVMGISNVGISQMAKEIHKVSHEEGQIAIDKRFINFFYACADKKIFQIIDGEYDYGKRGQLKAINLVTKYAYFLTEQKFPIYDKFVMKALKNLSKEKIQHHIQGKKIGQSTKPDNFFEVMHAVSNKIGDNKIGTGVDRFDAFCWSWGKIAESEDGVVGVFDKYESQKFDEKLKNENVKLIRPMDDKEKEQKKGKKKERKIEKIIKLADCSQELADIIGSL